MSCCFNLIIPIILIQINISQADVTQLTVTIEAVIGDGDDMIAIDDVRISEGACPNEGKLFNWIHIISIKHTQHLI